MQKVAHRSDQPVNTVHKKPHVVSVKTTCGFGQNYVWFHAKPRVVFKKKRRRLRFFLETSVSHRVCDAFTGTVAHAYFFDHSLGNKVFLGDCRAAAYGGVE